MKLNFDPKLDVVWSQETREIIKSDNEYFLARKYHGLSQDQLIAYKHKRLDNKGKNLSYRDLGDLEYRHKASTRVIRLWSECF